MITQITMPKLSDTMTEGLFAGWRKNIGDRIERGDIIAEVETDKAVMELEAFTSGVLLKTLANNGDQVPVGTVLGLIGEPGELEEGVAAAPVESNEVTVVATETPAELPEEPREQTAPAQLASNSGSLHEKASPLVRRLARERDIDLGAVHGTGPDGRITQEDLDRFGRQSGQQVVETTKNDAAAPETGGTLPVEPATKPPVNTMRQAITATVTQSWQTIPHYNATMEVDMGACREIVNETKAGSRKIGYNGLLIKGCAIALEQYPLLRPVENGNDINISFAVALDDGLLMPVIRRCDSLTVLEIEAEITRLKEKCRSGRLSSEEMRGGCFSVSNLGMYGVDNFAALIMPGQTAILAIGAITERPVVREGQVVVAAVMRVTLSSDHRVIDGAYAARFLAELRDVLEKPVSLLV